MRGRFERYRTAATGWWADNSGYILLPFGVVAFCVTVYEMLHGVM